jgi:hypothetical protein
MQLMQAVGKYSQRRKPAGNPRRDKSIDTAIALHKTSDLAYHCVQVVKTSLFFVEKNVEERHDALDSIVLTR